MPDPAAEGFARESLQWQRSPHCSASTCVEVARLSDGRVAVRDSAAATAGNVLIFGQAEWAEFVAAVRAGELG